MVAFVTSIATAALLTFSPPLRSTAATSRAAVRMLDMAVMSDSANACLVASVACTPAHVPEVHLFEGFHTLWDDMVWTIGVAGFGLAGAYMTQGAEAISYDDDDDAWFDNALGQQSRSLRSRDDDMGGDDPF